MIPKGMSNLQVAQAARDVYKGDKVIPSTVIANLDPIREGLSRVEKAVTQIEVYKGLDFDKHQEALTFTVEKRGKRVRKHKKIGGVFGD